MKTNANKWRSVLVFGLLVASVGSETQSAEPNSGDVIENSIKMKLTFIPPGEFDMGTRETGEKPVYIEIYHHVRLSKGFYLGIHEVTQAQFQQVLRRNPAWFSNGGGGKTKVVKQDTGLFPVEKVAWYDTIEFCNELSKREGLPEYYSLKSAMHKDGAITSALVKVIGGNGYRLPTEAEWEYGCRAGSKKPFHFGDVLNGEEANVNGNIPYGTTSKGTFLERTCMVGSYSANIFGLHDMHGNVREWCEDWYAVDYTKEVTDPKGPATGKQRVIRGGSWNRDAESARSAYRLAFEPEERLASTGFRVARSP